METLKHMGFPKVRGTLFLGVKILVFWGLSWVPLVLEYHTLNPKANGLFSRHLVRAFAGGDLRLRMRQGHGPDNQDPSCTF